MGIQGQEFVEGDGDLEFSINYAPSGEFSVSAFWGSLYPCKPVH